MPVRQVVTRRSNHFRTIIPTLKNVSPARCESLLEGKFIWICELYGQIASFEVQPSVELIHVGGRVERYIPDLRVDFINGTEAWFEIKPLARLGVERVAQRMAAAKKHFAESGRLFHVITDVFLNAEPCASNVRTIAYHRRGRLLPTELNRIDEMFQSVAPKTLGELIDLLGELEAWQLLGLGRVGVDLEKKIDSDALIFLEGGHRHANLFA
ncbi:MAG: transposase [Proteobacteria bacterium]|nr:transposase [Pseudomonadota bacterium]